MFNVSTMVTMLVDFMDLYIFSIPHNSWSNCIPVRETSDNVFAAVPPPPPPPYTVRVSTLTVEPIRELPWNSTQKMIIIRGCTVWYLVLGNYLLWHPSWIHCRKISKLCISLQRMEILTSNENQEQCYYTGTVPNDLGFRWSIGVAAILDLLRQNYIIALISAIDIRIISAIDIRINSYVNTEIAHEPRCAAWNSVLMSQFIWQPSWIFFDKMS